MADGLGLGFPCLRFKIDSSKRPSLTKVMGASMSKAASWSSGFAVNGADWKTYFLVDAQIENVKD